MWPVAAYSLAVAAAIILPAIAAAQTAPSDSSTPTALTLPTVEVIGTSPLPGIGIDRDKVPANVQSVTSSAISQREGSPSLLNGLTDQTGSVNINANLDDPFQPDVLYRGFEASPVLGTPQGLAVYQNGVRVNEAFGDTVNWDLIPDIAIDRVDIVSANPVYGLNALGGAVLVTMKNGFTYQGFQGELAGGSFGQRSDIVRIRQAGRRLRRLSRRPAVRRGWLAAILAGPCAAALRRCRRARRAACRSTSASPAPTIVLSGEGTTPEQELAVSRSLVFTTPQNNVNQLAFVTLNGSL